MSTLPTPMKGRLIQKIQRHETFCEKPPPSRGPATVPFQKLVTDSCETDTKLVLTDSPGRRDK